MRNPDSSPATLERAGVAVTATGRPRLRLWQHALRWHRALGVSAALFATFLALTGLVLMHSDRLGLPQQQVTSRWLLDWYGIRPPPPPLGLAVDGRWLTQFGSRIYLDEHALEGVNGTLLGAVEIDGMLQIATDRALTLVAPTGEIVEKLGEEAGMPAGVTAAGPDAQGRLVLKSAQGSHVYDDTLGEFAAVTSTAAPAWQSLHAPPAAITAALTATWQGEGLPLERVVLDLHAGRLFGVIGVWVVNLASIALVLLALSGVCVWWKRRPRR